MSRFITNKHNPVSPPEAGRVPAPRGARLKKLFAGRGVSSQALADFFDHLATLLASGVTLVTALEFMRGSTREHGLRAALDRITASIREGEPFSRALAAEPVFDKVTVGMIRAGEAGGRLEAVAAELALEFARRAETRSQLLQAMTYPCIVAVFGFLTVIVLLLFVIPKISSVFELWDAPLPWMTRVLLGASRFMRRGGFLVLLVPFAAVPYLKSGRYGFRRKFLEPLLAKTPFVRDVFFLDDFVRLSRTWGMLLRSGVPIIDAIRSSRDVLAGASLRSSLDAVAEKIIRGARLQEAIETEPWLPELAKNFLKVGEETGTLDESFAKIAKFYERELKSKLKIVSTLIEPALILGVGVSVGLLVISMLLPIFEMSLVVR